MGSHPLGLKAGGIQDIHVNQSIAVEAAHVLKVHLNATKLKVLKASSQVVQGENVFLHAETEERMVRAHVFRPPRYTNALVEPQFIIQAVNDIPQDAMES